LVLPSLFHLDLAGDPPLDPLLIIFIQDGVETGKKEVILIFRSLTLANLRLFLAGVEIRKEEERK